MSARRACGSVAPSVIGCRVRGSSSPTASQVMPGRHSAWRGRFGLDLSRQISPLTLRYEALLPSWRHSACLPSVRYSGSRYLSQSVGSSTTWLSLSNTEKSLLGMAASTVRCWVCLFGGHSADRCLGPQRGADLFVGRPPVGALDLGDAVADDSGRRLYLVEPAGVGAEEFGLILLRQIVFLHRFDRPPDVVAVVMIDIRRPAEDVAIELRQPRRRCFVALEAGHAMLEESLAWQPLQGRQLPLVFVEPVGLVALVDQEAEPSR